MSKLPKALAMFSLLVPMGAGALGVGDIRVNSGMNQYLEAEIPLVLSGADSLNEIRVNLASPEEFAKAGVDRQFFLTRLQFRAIQKPDGRYAIRVTSREAMREPFLNFLVEVNWPKGRALREFTVLLDPPAFAPDVADQDSDSTIVEPPRTTYGRPRTPERIAEIHRAGETPAPSRRHRHSISAVPAPEPVAPDTQEFAESGPPGRGQFTGETYGPVRRDETLWGIARQIDRDSSITQEQLVMGLYHANRQAFSGGVNSLRAGSVLQIPTRDFLTRLSPGEARAEFARQQGWRAGAVASGRYREPPAPLEEAAPQSQVRLLPPPAPKSRGGGMPAEIDSDGGIAGRSRTDADLEMAGSLKKENDEFRSRLAQLEQRLGDLQKLLVAKDEQIGDLLARQRSEPVAPAPTVRPPVTGVSVSPAPPAPTGTSVGVPPVAVPAPRPSVPPSVPLQAPRPAAPLPSATPSAPPVHATPTPSVPPIAAAPAAVPGTAEGLPLDPTYLGLAGGLALLGTSAWLLKRRRDALLEATDAIPLGTEAIDDDGSAVDKSLAGAHPADRIVDPTRDAIYQEYAPAGYDALSSDVEEVDPTSEADVYLAYGRNKQAEDLIRNAIANHPDRDDFKLKLLEIFQTTENQAGFDAYVDELRAQKLDAQGVFWGQVQEKIREFRPRTDGPEAILLEPEELLSGLGDFDLDPAKDHLIEDLKTFDGNATPAAERAEASPPKPAPMDAVAPSPSAAFEDAFEFDLDLEGDSLSQFKEAEPDTATSLGDIDLGDEPLIADFRVEEIPSVDALDLDFGGLERGAEPKSVREDPDDGSLDGLGSLLDFDLEIPEPVTGESSDDGDALLELENLLALDSDPKVASSSLRLLDLESEEAGEPEKSIDDILRELTADLESDAVDEPALEAAAASPAEPEVVDDFNFNFDLDDLGLALVEEDEPPAPDHPEVALFADDGDASGLDELDPIALKLDLAKAYSELGDHESAEEILKDLTDTGDEQQRTEAGESPGRPGGTVVPFPPVTARVRSG